MVKVIELVGESEKVITELCDAALKSAGFQAHHLVSKVIAMIKDVEYKEQPKPNDAEQTNNI